MIDIMKIYGIKMIDIFKLYHYNVIVSSNNNY